MVLSEEVIRKYDSSFIFFKFQSSLLKVTISST